MSIDICINIYHNKYNSGEMQLQRMLFVRQDSSFDCQPSRIRISSVVVFMKQNRCKKEVSSTESCGLRGKKIISNKSNCVSTEEDT